MPHRFDLLITDTASACILNYDIKPPLVNGIGQVLRSYIQLRFWPDKNGNRPYEAVPKQDMGNRHISFPFCSRNVEPQVCFACRVAALEFSYSTPLTHQFTASRSDARACNPNSRCESRYLRDDESSETDSKCSMPYTRYIHIGNVKFTELLVAYRSKIQLHLASL